MSTGHNNAYLAPFKFFNVKTTAILFGFLVILLITGCNTKTGSHINPLQGDWAFLDKYGNYNEAWFGDSLYATYNKFTKRSPDFRYSVKNDSLWSNVDKRRKGMSPIAAITWLPDGRVILNTEFVRDTLQKIKEDEVTLGNVDMAKDSSAFREAFNARYEEFLISKEIISRDEMKEFKQHRKIPKDVMKELQKDTL